MQNQDKWGNTTINPVRDFFAEVSLGRVPGYASICIFAHCKEVYDIATIWDEGGMYTYLTADTVLYVSSSDENDTNVFVYVKGLNDEYEEINTVVQVNGQNQVEIDTEFFRVTLLAIVGGIEPLGDIYVAEADTLTDGVPNIASKIKSKIIQGINLSRNGLYTIPLEKTIVLRTIRGSVAKSKDAQIVVCTKSYGGVFCEHNPYQLFQNHFEFDVSQSGISFEEKTDIEFRGCSSYSTEISMEIEALVVDM